MHVLEFENGKLIITFVQIKFTMITHLMCYISVL